MTLTTGSHLSVLSAVHQRRLFGIVAVVADSASYCGSAFRGAYRFDGTHTDTGRSYLSEQVGDGSKNLRCMGEHGGEGTLEEVYEED